MKAKHAAKNYFNLYYKFLKKQQVKKQLKEKARNAENSAIGLIIDSSGSMKDNDPNDIRKEAVEMIVDQLNPVMDIIIVDFDKTATWINEDNWHEWDRAKLKKSIKKIDSAGGTNIGNALATMSNVLQDKLSMYNAGGILLLTDGLGDYNNQAEWFAKYNIPVYPISLIGDANAKLLSNIAVLTGGEYMKAATSMEIVEAFNKFYLLLNSANRLVFVLDKIFPQMKKYIPFVVDTMPFLNIILAWPGSKVGLNLISPSGVKFQEGAKNAQWFPGKTYTLVRIDNPEPGQWKAELTGIDVSPQGEVFTFDVNGQSELDINFDLEQNIADYSGGALTFHLDINKPLTKILNITPEIELTTPKNKKIDLSNSYKQNKFTYIPRSGSGNYQFVMKVKGEKQNGMQFQRYINRTIYLGEFAPPNVGTISKLMGTYAIATLGNQIGNRAGVRCFFYKSGKYPNNRFAEGYVTSVGLNECTIEVQKVNPNSKIETGDVIELDLLQWKSDQP